MSPWSSRTKKEQEAVLNRVREDRVKGKVRTPGHDGYPARSKAALIKTGRTYDVVGRSGGPAGLLGKNTHGWLLMMFGTPGQAFLTFKGAKEEALKQAERY